MYDLIINDNFNTREIGLVLAERITIPVAILDYEDITIPGRHGNLTKELGYKNREITVKFNYYYPYNFTDRVRQFTKVFQNAKTIMLTDDTEVFYKVLKVNMNDISRQIRNYGFFEVTFEIEPFAYLTRVFPKRIAKPTSLINLGTYYSEPYIKIFGSGNIKLNINGVTTEFLNVEDFIEIDSEIKETFKNDSLQNNRKVGAFPIFTEGRNTIDFTGNVKEIEIHPRWRCL